MQNKTIASEAFSSGKKNFFLDFKLAQNRTNYISITRSDENGDGSYHRKSIVIFEEDFEFLISAFSSLFRTAAYVGEKEQTVRDLFQQKEKEKQRNGIPAMEPEEKPREKFYKFGAGVLSNAELLAMLIGSGTQQETAIELSERILKENGYDLKKISKLKHSTLSAFKGVGLAKSSAILAALELGRRAFGAESMFTFPKGRKPIGILK